MPAELPDVRILKSSDSRDLLALARAEYDVTPFEHLDDAADWLNGFGRTVVVPDFGADHFDEHVDGSRVVLAFRVHAPDFFQSHASTEERQMRDEALAEHFDPLEYGPDMEDDTRFAREMELLESALVIFERAADDPTRVGNFRVYGGAQWLREALWAATGVVPRDTGNAEESAELFGDACVLAGRGRFESKPINGWQPLP